MDFVSIRRQDAVAVMHWHRNEQNRLNTPLIREIQEALENLAGDETVNGVVVTSEYPKYFSSGIDLEWMTAEGARDKENLRTFMHTLNRFMIAVTGFPKPLVAAINGHAVGAGVLVAACMDFRLMRQDQGLIRLPAVNIDLLFWPGMLAILKEVMTDKGMRELVFTGDRYTGRQALEMGLVDRLYPSDQLIAKAVELAAGLGQSNTETYAAIKLEMRRTVIETMKSEDPKAIERAMARFASSMGT